VDLQTFIAFLTLLVVVFGAMLAALWGRQNKLFEQFSDYREKAAERFVTVSELDKLEERFYVALEPIQDAQKRIEDQLLVLLENTKQNAA